MTASRSLDGFSFDHFRARLTGTVELEEAEAQAAALDETLVMVVVARVKDIQAKMDGRGEEAGELSRVAVCKATDARIIEDVDLRNLLVERLGLYGEDTYVPTKAETVSPIETDLETGEILGDEDWDDEADEGPVVVSAPSDGVRSVRFDTLEDEHPNDREVVGRIPGTGDQALAGFLSDVR